MLLSVYRRDTLSALRTLLLVVLGVGRCVRDVTHNTNVAYM